MARDGQAMKDRVLGRLLPPESAAIEEVSREVGVSVDTFERWRVEAMGRPVGSREWLEDLERRSGLPRAPGKRRPKPKEI